MDKMDKVARMAELKKSVEERVEAYNEKILDGKYEDAVKINEETIECVNEYTSIARGICFEECLKADNPMIEAAKRLTFRTIGIKDTKQGDEKIPIREVVDREKPIDILKLSKCKKGGIGSNKDWPLIIEKFNKLLTIQKAIDLGIDPREIDSSYAMSKMASEYDIGCGKNPVSKTKLLGTLRTVIQAMIGEDYKPISCDVNFLLSVYTRKDRAALTVNCANHRYLRNYLMEICHHLVTGEPYKVAYKAKK